MNAFDRICVNGIKGSSLEEEKSKQAKRIMFIDLLMAYKCVMKRISKDQLVRCLFHKQTPIFRTLKISCKIVHNMMYHLFNLEWITSYPALTVNIQQTSKYTGPRLWITNMFGLFSARHLSIAHSYLKPYGRSKLKHWCKHSFIRKVMNTSSLLPYRTWKLTEHIYTKI